MPRSPAPRRNSLLSAGMPGELRALLPLAGVTAAVLIAAVVGFLGPWSPQALDRPAALLAEDPAAAADAWLALADNRLAGPSNRAAALWRAAQVTATTLDAPAAADALALRLIVEHPSSPDVGEAMALRGLIAQRNGQPAEAVRHFVAAADALGDGPRAGALLLAAAQVDPAASGLDPAAHEALLRRAAQEPTTAARAWLALGNQMLETTPAAAYEAYAQALKAAGADQLSGQEEAARTARLGMATALERLEGREAAVAAVDDPAADPSLDAADTVQPKRRAARSAKRRR